MQVSDRYAPARALLVTESYRRIGRPTGYAGRSLFMHTKILVRITSRFKVRIPEDSPLRTAYLFWAERILMILVKMP